MFVTPTVYRSQWVPTSVPTEVEPTDEVRAIGPCDDRDDLPLHRLAHRHDDSPMPPSFRSAVQLIAFDGLSQASVGVPYSADGRPMAPVIGDILHQSIYNLRRLSQPFG